MHQATIQPKIRSILKTQSNQRIHGPPIVSRCSTSGNRDAELRVTLMEAQCVVVMRPATPGFVRQLDSDGISGRARLLQSRIFPTTQSRTGSAGATKPCVFIYQAGLKPANHVCKAAPYRGLLAK